MRRASVWLRFGTMVGSLGLVFLTGCSLGSSQSAVNGTPQPSYIFQDPLTSNTNNWSNDSNCFFGAGGYHIKGAFICFAPIDDVADAVATVTVKQLSGTKTISYGIVFRHPSTGNYYAFEIDSNGKWQFYKDVGGQYTALANYQANAAIHKGLNVANTLQVRAVGQNYTFFVNGTKVGQYADATYTAPGSWGLDSADGVEVVYSNFLMTKP